MPRLTSDPPRVNPLLLAFARKVRSLDKMPRRQAVRSVGQIVPIVVGWIAAHIERRRSNER